MRVRIYFRFYFIVPVLSLLIAACSSTPTEPAQKYALRGKVISVEKDRRTVTVEHEEIEAFMPAMTMPFNVKEKDDWAFQALSQGKQLAATLVVQGTSSWIEDIVVSDTTVVDEEKAKRAKGPAPGDLVPSLSLTNQDGKRINLENYRGKTLLLTFIYTRCPLPEYCTLMSTNFAEIEKALAADLQLYSKTHLLSISIDPEYDTPRVLRSYGASHTGRHSKEDFSHWEFATGSAEEVRAVADFFGLTYSPASGEIVHSLRTALIGPDGKLLKLYTGNDWKPSDVVSEIKQLGKW